MLQRNIPFEPPRPEMDGLPYREKLHRLLEGNLDFHGQKSNLILHSLHAFPAKFPPHLPEIFIRELTQPADIIYDPMMGSGTTLIESIRLGRRAVGTDIDPLSIRLVSAKMNISNVCQLQSAGRLILKNARAALEKKTLLTGKLKKRFDQKTADFINYWFSIDNQLELTALINEIEKIEDRHLKTFLTLIFSSIIITKSGGVSLARDLAHTRPHRVTDKKPKSALDAFEKRLAIILKKVTTFPHRDFAVMEANAKTVPLADNSIDLIVTSPPYASNAIDYMRAHKFSLVWLQHSIASLGSLRRKYIGGENTQGVALLPLPEYSSSIVQSLSELDAKKSKVLHRYYSEMTCAFAEMHRVLKPGCAAVIIVGTSVIRGMNIEIRKCFEEIGKKNGFEHIYTGLRQLDRDKRMMPARWNKSPKEGIEARMHEEYVIGYIKPEAPLP